MELTYVCLSVGLAQTSVYVFQPDFMTDKILF